MTKIAIIGTAGRDKTKPMTKGLWAWMLDDVRSRVPVGALVVSGGAAWADHLAVRLFLEGHAGALTLHLPAPMDQEFLGPYKSAASAANFYHKMFSERIGINSLQDIADAASMPNCFGSFQPMQSGYGGMFVRNAIVAREAEELLAYTFGEGDQPADGGTLDTWNKCTGVRTHITLPIIY